LWNNNYRPTSSNWSPFKIRSGDYDLDGYPDLIFATKKEGSPSQIEVWRSTACSTSQCTPEAVNRGRRTFTRIGTNIANDLNKIEGAFAGVFYDLDEDGVNDVIVLSENTKNGSTTLTISAIYNNVYIDAYFFKTLALNGVCTQWCSEGQLIPDPKPYGVNQHGATMKFSFADMNGITHANAVPQLCQSSHLALQTPYTLNGLGRPSNYISYFFMGVPIASDNNHWYSWSGLIPNSQIVGIPYPPNEPTSWQPELYITPSGITLWIVVAIVVLLIIIGIGIIVLTKREKRQDEAEKKEREHLFSFKAL